MMNKSKASGFLWTKRRREWLAAGKWKNVCIPSLVESATAAELVDALRLLVAKLARSITRWWNRRFWKKEEKTRWLQVARRQTKPIDLPTNTETTKSWLALRPYLGEWYRRDNSCRRIGSIALHWRVRSWGNHANKHWRRAVFEFLPCAARVWLGTRFHYSIASPPADFLLLSGSLPARFFSTGIFIFWMSTKAASRGEYHRRRWQ